MLFGTTSHLNCAGPKGPVVSNDFVDPVFDVRYALEAFAKSSLGHGSDHVRFEVGKGGLPPLLPNMYLIWKSGGKPPFLTVLSKWHLR